MDLFFGRRLVLRGITLYFVLCYKIDYANPFNELVLKSIKETYCKFPDCLPHAPGLFRGIHFPGEGD
jgi:hypothetical protein